MIGQTFEWTPNQNIDSPFTAVSPSLLWNPGRFFPFLARRVRERFNLIPVFTRAKSGLMVPANDQLLRKAA